MTAPIRFLRPCHGLAEQTRDRRHGWGSMWLWPMVLMAALVAAGCGGSEEPEPEPPAPPSESSEEPTEEPAEKPAPPKEEEPAPAEPQAALPEEPVEEIPPRPESVAEWSEADFFSAKEQRDPRLIDALAFLAERDAGQPETAELMAGLLATAEVPEPDPSPVPKAEPEPKPDSDDGYEEGYEEEDYDDSYDEDYDGDYEDGYDDDDDYDDGYEDGYDDDSGSGRRTVKALEDVELLKPGYVSLIGAIVRALGANGTDASRQVLEQLLTGTLETGNDRLAVSATLKTLTDNPSAENEALLFRALTQPEVMRPAERGQVTAEQLRETVLQMVVEEASSDMRFNLAKHLFTANPPAELRDRLVTFITATHPNNVRAQVAVYERPQTGQSLKQDLEVFFTTYGSMTMGRLLGVSLTQSPEEELALPMGPSEPGTVGETGSSDPFADNAMTPERTRQDDSDDEYDDEEEEEEYEDDYDDEMSYDEDYDEDYNDGSGRRRPQKPSGDPGNWAAGGGRPDDTGSIEAFELVAGKDGQLAQELAGDLWSTRFSGVLARNVGSAASLETDSQLVNLASTTPTDTVRAALFRMLATHWKDGPQGIFTASALPETGTIDPGFLAVVKNVPHELPEKDDAEKPEHLWLDSSHALLRYLCLGLHQAALNRPAGTDIEQLSETLPLTIHGDAVVAAAYRLDWQKEVGPLLSGASVDPLVIQYVRIEQDDRYSRMLGYYRRAISGADVHEMDHVAWVDSYRPAEEPGRKRSVDVLITREPENTDPRSTQDEPLVVEILSVEINDPAAQP